MDATDGGEWKCCLRHRSRRGRCVRRSRDVHHIRRASRPTRTLETLQTKTDRKGEARLDGILPGTWVVSARDEEGKGHAEKSVSVSDKEAACVDLELEGVVSLKGTVREAFGAPPPGARVACILPGADGLAHLVSASTSDDGTFSIDGKKISPSSVPCSVTSFSGAQGYRVTPGESADLILPAAPAELQVLSLPPVNRLSTLWLVSQDGRLVDVTAYIQRGSETAMLVIPAVAPDQWKLVRVSSLADWVALTSGAMAVARRSARWVTLAAGEEAPNPQ